MITGAVGKMSEFLTEFEGSFRYRLTKLNEKLTHVQRRIEYMEARIDVKKQQSS